MKTNHVKATILTSLLLWSAFGPVQAQYSFISTNGAIIITGYDCTGPGNLIVPSAINNLPVRGIGAWAFFNCSNLTNLTIPDSVANLGDYALSHCTSLTSATLGTGITTIENSEFWYCLQLTNVTILGSVTSIGTNAFQYCPWLSTLTFPKTVTNIGHDAFSLCTNMTGVYFEGNAPAYGFPIFNGTTNVTVYYLLGTTGWGPTFAGRPTAVWTPKAVMTTPGFSPQTYQFGFSIAFVGGRVVVVEACTNVTTASWVPVWTNPLTGGSAYFSDPDSTNHPGRYYRLRSL